MDMSKYRGIFLSEAREHIREMSRIVLAVEGGAIDGESINALFRQAHSVKGMAASMGYARMEALAHHLENALEGFRLRGGVPLQEVDRLLEGIDLLEQLLHDLEAERPERDIAPYLATTSDPLPCACSVALVPSISHEAITAEIEGSELRFRRDDTLRTVRVQTQVLDRFVDLTGELITSRYMLQSAAEAKDWEALQRHLEHQGRLIGDLHHQVRQVRLMPLESLTGRLPRLVRDLTRRTGKKVRLQIEGEELELDRGVLEAIADPLVHLVRNAVDHGIVEHGTVSVRAWRERDQAILEVADDGRGIDVDRVVRKALEKHLITSALASSLPRREILQLICAPGLSTAGTITETSGRGVGMDVVKSALEGIGGRLEIASKEGKGTRFRLHLPLSAAIIHLLLVDCGGHRLGIPFNRVQRLLEIRPDQVRLRQGKASSFVLGEEDVPLVSLRKILRIGAGQSGAATLSVVLTEMRGRRVGLVVDRTAGGRQAFVKGLSYPLDQLQGVTGSTILGDGRIIFVIDPQSLTGNRFGRGAHPQDRESCPSAA
jgi:two-component system, chemotaxis family, sensor kinase CheA